MDAFIIRLEDLRFFAKIGVSEQERLVGNSFRVNVSLQIPCDRFVPEDIDSTISYADVYEMIRNIMSEEALLLETVAEKIAGTLRAKWPEIESLGVKISKLSPPIAGINGSCSVEYISDGK